jgi:hypothetical protein
MTTSYKMLFPSFVLSLSLLALLLLLHILMFLPLALWFYICNTNHKLLCPVVLKSQLT